MVKRAIPPLVLERVFDNVNLYILSVVEYKRKHFLCIIDDIGATQISAYVLDFAEREKIDVNEFLSYAIKWYYSSSNRLPFSLFLARYGMKDTAQKIHMQFNKAYVGRVIGQPFSYNLNNIIKQRKRKANIVPSYVEVRFKGKVEPLGEFQSHLPLSDVVVAQ